MMLFPASRRYPNCFLRSLLCAALLCLVFAGDRLPASAQSAPLVASPTPPVADAVPVMASPYALAPGDQIEIHVEGYSEFNATATILPDGTFDYIGQGAVQAAGLTVKQVERILTTRLLRQLRHPQVTVFVRDSHPRQVSILGAVRTPGVYNWRPGLMLLEAIAASGGPAQAPEVTQATLVTNQGTKDTPLDLARLIEDHDLTQNVALAPGDIILMSLRDPAAAYVQVEGQVAHAGPYPVPTGGATVQAVLAQAGGYTSAAALTHVQVTHDGQTRTLNLRPLLFRSDDPIGKTRVVAGDIVSVPLNNGKIAVYGEVRNPSIYPVPDGEPLTVTTALGYAGGPTNVGDRRNVSIVRYTPDGRQTVIAENVDEVLKGDNKAVDVPLQPGDILVVPKRRAGVNGLSAFQTGLGTVFGFNALSVLLRGH